MLLLPKMGDDEKNRQKKSSATERMESIMEEIKDDERFDQRGQVSHSCNRLRSLESKLNSLGSNTFGIFWRTRDCMSKECRRAVKCGSVD